jgi:hypothetical protein
MPSDHNAAPKRVLVLGTSHKVQGAKYEGSVDDPDYAVLVERVISEEAIDFIFEEASECGPTTAEGLARDSIPVVKYLDVDPHPKEQHKFGICKDTGEPFPDYLSHESEEIIEEASKREELWIKRISQQDFKSGLVICGYKHTFSFAFKLRSGGFRVKSLCYIPHDKLCGHA